MTTKWTKGPWRMGNHGQFGTFIPPQIFAGDKSAVASVYGIPLHTTLEEVDRGRFAEGIANAQLIASAPDLYKKLAEMSLCLADVGSNRGGWDWELVLQEAETIMAAARGEQ